MKLKQINDYYKLGVNLTISFEDWCIICDSNWWIQEAKYLQNEHLQFCFGWKAIKSFIQPTKLDKNSHHDPIISRG